MRKLYEMEKCEAAKADGSRCQAEAIDYVKNPGAYLSYQVCGTHKRSGEKLLARDGQIPATWGKYNFGTWNI
jgi:hypothetical protein